MSENTEKLIIDTATGEATENASIALSENGMPTLMYVLERIEAISRDTAHVHSALSQLQELKAAGPGDICGQSKADAIAHVVDAREETNRKLLGFYEMIYKDILKSEKDKKVIPEQFLEIINAEEDSEARREMFHDLCNRFGG